MTTLPAPGVKHYPENSLEKKCYNIVESLKEYIPVMNDRNRLGFNLYKFMKGEGDSPKVIVRNIKIKIEGISQEDLASKIDEALREIKS